MLSKHWYVYRERNDKNPTAKCEKYWFRASLLINFGRASVVISVAPNLAVLQIMQVFRI